MQTTGNNQTCNSRENAGQHEHHNLGLMHGDTGEPRGFHIAANRIHGTTNTGEVQNHGGDDAHDDHHDNWDRDTKYRAAEEIDHTGSGNRSPIGNDQGQAASNGHHCQCRNEGRQLQERIRNTGKRTEYSTGYESNNNGENRRQPHRSASVGNQHTGYGSNRADGQVNTSLDDDKGLAECQNGDGRSLNTDIQQIRPGQESRSRD